MPTPATSPQTVVRRDMSSGPGTTAGHGLNVEGFDQTGSGFGGASGLATLDDCCALARQVLEAEGVSAGQLDLIVVDPEDMAELNETHMGHEGPTDVLSFPMDADEVALMAQDRPDGVEGGTGGVEDGTVGFDGQPPLHLGDVVLCPAVAERQAPDHCGTVEAELSLLIIHGVLHILGHDHAEPEETTVMQARERHHLANLGFAHPVSA